MEAETDMDGGGISIDREMSKIMEKFPEFLQWSMENEELMCPLGPPDEHDWEIIIREYHQLHNEVWRNGFAIPGYGCIDLFIVYPPNTQPTRCFLFDDNTLLTLTENTARLKPKISITLVNPQTKTKDVINLTEYIVD